jgi:hypothetical protein
MESQHPYLLIGPVKAELISFHPIIVRYHHLLTPNTVYKLKNSFTDSMERSRMGAAEVGIVNEYRTSVNTWIKDWNLPAYEHMAPLLSAVTGLLVTEPSSHELQIASYAVGGHYQVHQDAVRESYICSVKRILSLSSLGWSKTFGCTCVVR